jgi:hypothetical protein
LSRTLHTMNQLGLAASQRHCHFCSVKAADKAILCAILNPAGC